MGHNWVHFALPSAVAVITKKVLPDSSILKQLLLPHIRFTSRINHQGYYSRSDCLRKEANQGSESRIYQKRFFYQLQVKIQMVLSIGTSVHGQVYQ